MVVRMLVYPQMSHHDAFQNGGYSSDTLRNANLIHGYMGYAFYVSKVAAYQSSVNATKEVDISVQVAQLGVAPFYYDLSLVWVRMWKWCF
jgi:hypothetical protein